MEKNEMFGIRHSIAEYKSYKKVLASENPEAPINQDDQDKLDLTPEGIKLAKKEAENFFSNLNPETDALFFASSDQVRAIETANIYREIAKQMGFEIIKPHHVDSNYAQEIGQGDIRVVRNLSLTIKNVLIQELFTPQKNSHEINWKNIPTETKEKWERAKSIVNAHDYGSWGANFFHHSREIQEIFEEVSSAKDLFEKQFKNILILIQFADKKIRESESEKKIKVLGFGHENYLAYVLEKYFKDHEIKNCEAIKIEVEGGKIIFERRGEKKEL